MTKSYPARRRDRSRYWHQTQRPLHSLVFILPMLLFFQIGAAYCGTHLLAPHDVGRLLRYFGATSAYLPPLLIVVVLLIQHAARRDRWEVKPKVLAGMFGESVLLVVPLIALSLVGGRIAAGAAGAADPAATFQGVLNAVGAGIYEEFLFRLGLIGLTMLLFVDLLSFKEEYVGVAAVLASAALFSMYHFRFFSGSQPFAHGRHEGKGGWTSKGGSPRGE